MKKNGFAKLYAGTAAVLLTAVNVCGSMNCAADIQDENGDTIETVVCGDYEYSVMVSSEDNSKKAACIEKYKGDEKDVVIPDTLNDLAVVALGETVFAGNYTVQTITLPVNLIGIGAYAFAECRALKTIEVAEGNAIFENRDGVLYAQDGKWLVCYPIQNVPKEVTIADGVEQICGSAFAYSEMEKITLPESLTAIGAGAFAGCLKLEEITIPSKVTRISRNMFYECKALKTVTLPDGVTEIGDTAFANTALETIKIPSKCVTIGQAAFAATNMKSVEIPPSVTEIGYSAFGYKIDSTREFYRDDSFVIYGAQGSAAASYAKDTENGNNFEFVNTSENNSGSSSADESSAVSENSEIEESSANAGSSAAEESSAAPSTTKKEKAEIGSKSKGLIIGVIAGGAVLLIGIVAAIVAILRKDKKPEN